MSNLYVTEPATNAKVIVDTTAGEIELELWGKEAPKAVRNFLALSMEGYYDGVIFHRIVPGFIVQTGDPTGTGTGGESFYGEPFEDEKHGRLRFNRRGLVGMANSGKRNTNTSQFFITLDKADELTNKHTLFGKVTGNTIFNVLNIGNLDIDADERPLVPPKIRTIRIIENPFDDIVPRITAADRRAQQQARIDAKKELEQRERRARAKKNTGLLSFGEAEEVPEVPVKTGISRQDLLPDAPSKRREDLVASAGTSGTSAGTSGTSATKEPRSTIDLKSIRAQHAREKAQDSASRQAEIQRMQHDLRNLKKQRGEESDSESDSGKRRKRGISYLEEELAKYSKGRGRAARSGKRAKRVEEDDLLLELGKFSKRVTELDEAEEEAAGEEGEMEVDDDVGWMRHRLHFEVDEQELTRRAEDEYSVIDPRAKARELAEQEKRR